MLVHEAPLVEGKKIRRNCWESKWKPKRWKEIGVWGWGRTSSASLTSSSYASSSSLLDSSVSLSSLTLRFFLLISNSCYLRFWAFSLLTSFLLYFLLENIEVIDCWEFAGRWTWLEAETEVTWFDEGHGVQFDACGRAWWWFHFIDSFSGIWFCFFESIFFSWSVVLNYVIFAEIVRFVNSLVVIIAAFFFIDYLPV